MSKLNLENLLYKKPNLFSANALINVKNLPDDGGDGGEGGGELPGEEPGDSEDPGNL